jgi:phosphatidylglycerol:prolipoprotein diacylglycerol transferase
MPEWMEDTAIAFPFLGIYLENVPKSFQIFGVTIALYGVIIGFGVICAFTLMAMVTKKDGNNPDDIYDAGMWILGFGLVGARLYYVIFSWDYYKNNLASIINIREGGLAIYGGVLAGLLTAFIWCRVKKKNLFAFLDIAALGVLTGQIIGRWGNFTNREVFGGYCANLFAMRLPIDAVRGRDISADLEAHIVEGTNYIQVHPTFLYESFSNLVLLILIIVFRKKKKFDGECILWYLGGYGIIRFFIEGIRTDQLKFAGTNLAVSQCLGMTLFIVSATLITFFRVRAYRSGKAGTIEKKETTEKPE